MDFPRTEFQDVISWLRKPGVPTLSLLQSILTVAKYLAEQAVSQPDAHPRLMAASPMSNDDLAVCLQKVVTNHESKAMKADSFDWATLLAVVMKLLSLFQK